MCSTSQIIREMQNKAKVRYPFVPSIMAVIQKQTTESQHLQGGREIGIFAGETVRWSAAAENSATAPQNIKNRNTAGSATPLRSTEPRD